MAVDNEPPAPSIAQLIFTVSALIFGTYWSTLTFRSSSQLFSVAIDSNPNFITIAVSYLSTAAAALSISLFANYHFSNICRYLLTFLLSAAVDLAAHFLSQSK
ncbi:hypothetical protein ACTXT7_016053 [Hymenolepis weldensis]